MQRFNLKQYLKCLSRKRLGKYKAIIACYEESGGRFYCVDKDNLLKHVISYKEVDLHSYIFYKNFPLLSTKDENIKSFWGTNNSNSFGEEVFTKIKKLENNRYYFAILTDVHIVKIFKVD